MFLNDVITTLNQYKVQYRLVGGYAVTLHGAVRGTVDIDLVVSLDQESYCNVEKALNSIGLKSRLPLSAIEVFNYREEYIKNRNLIAWSFVNPENPLEIVDIIITENAKKMRSVIKTAGGIRIKIATIENLIEMKTKSGRKQDLEDIKALEKL